MEADLRLAEAACFGARRRQLLRAEILADSGEFFGGFGGVRLSWQTDAVTRRLSPFFVESDLALAVAAFCEGGGFSARWQKSEAAFFDGFRFSAGGGGRFRGS